MNRHANFAMLCLGVGVCLHCDSGGDGRRRGGADPDGGAVAGDAAPALVDSGVADAGAPRVTVSIVGDGSVAIEPLGLTCPDECSADVVAGTILTLTAEPTPPALFAGWSGACAGTGSCEIVVDGDVAIGAAFGGRWSLTMGGADDDAATSLARVGADRLVVTGNFRGMAQFGPFVATSSNRDAFVVMMDAAGVVHWLETIVATTSTSRVTPFVAGNAAGDVVVGGSFKQTVLIGGVEESTGCCNEGVFAARFTSAGDYVWSTSFVGDRSIQATRVAVDGDGNVFLLGTFGGTMDFGFGDVTSDGTDGFLVALAAADGASMWVRTFAEPPRAVTADAASVFIAGDFGEPIDVGGGELSSPFAAVYAARYQATTGDHLWSEVFGQGLIRPSAMSARDGALAVVGQHNSNATFGSTTLMHNEAQDDFAVRLAPSDGSVMWANRLLTGGEQSGPTVSIDETGRVAVSGRFRSVGFFGGSLFESVDGSEDMYVAVFDAAGNHAWSSGFGTATSDEFITGIVAHGGLQTAVAGWARTGVDFGSGPLTTAGRDIFVANIIP